MADFVFRALTAGVLVALIAGPLGCFVIWRRMSYFGDTLAHSALFGIALGLILDINLQLAVVLSCILIAVILVLMENRKGLSTDTILGILAHSSLAVGLVLMSFTGNQVNLTAYLFGDLLTVSLENLYWIAGGVVLVLILLCYHWNQLLAITLHQELAQVEGLDVVRTRLILMLLIALMVAVSMKVVGVLLITSLLIIPPACAKAFARTPESMAAVASLTGCVAVGAGLYGSLVRDTPPGPSIVVAAALIFLVTTLLPDRQ